jgi:hypothetical protein
MHLKGYEIDGRLRRTGAANFSASGLKRQDNDLIVKARGFVLKDQAHSSQNMSTVPKPFFCYGPD